MISEQVAFLPGSLTPSFPALEVISIKLLKAAFSVTRNGYIDRIEFNIKYRERPYILDLFE
jgi:hypothetical protein